MTKLLNYLKTYTPTPSYNQEREDGRRSFVERFPKELLSEMKLEDYVVGGENKDTYSNWLEFKKILFGIGGGNASKFGVYVKKDDQSFRTGFSSNAQILEGEELQQYFENLKSNLVKAIDLAEQERVSEIKQLDLPIWNLVLEKILVIYFPDKFINVGSSEVLIACAKDLGMDHIELSNDNVVEINYELRKKIDSIPEFKGLDYIDIGNIVWEAYKDDVKREYYIIGTKYDGNKDIFPELLERSVIATGFASNLNLNDLFGARNKDIKKFLEDHGEQKSYNALNLFLNLKPGDLIALKADGSPKGTQPFLSIIGIAEVIEKDGFVYQHDPGGLGHLIHVKFLQAPVYKKFPIGGFGSTLQKVKKDEQIEQIFNTEYEILESHFKPQLSMSIGQNSQSSSFNQILYGPPGTGKTYHTITKAIGIVNPSFDPKQNRDKIKAEYNRLVENGQIVFTTFHQSMSYEDFIEGIKPTTLKDTEEDEVIDNTVIESKPIQYEIQDGIFKRLCQKAKGGALIDLDFEALWGKFFSHLINNKEAEVFKSVSSEIRFEKEGSSEEVLNVRFLRTTDDPTKEGKRIFHVRKNSIKKIFDERLDASDPNISTRQEIEKLLSAGRSTIYNAVYKSFFDFNHLGEKFKSKKTDENFVLIIDEINRGNVSQIFGELITLIEEDKRLGKEEELQVQLPYSKKPFGVPANLYIIGTMNTADRSVEALDAALRRRFSFEEMPPNYGLEELNRVIGGVQLSNLLKIINGRIEMLLDKDHLIGHSYFVKVKNIRDLQLVFQNKIIPLLQEYFFGDYGKIGLILGTKFFEEETKNNTVQLKSFFDYGDDGFEERKIYRLKDLSRMNEEDFKTAIIDLIQ